MNFLRSKVCAFCGSEIRAARADPRRRTPPCHTQRVPPEKLVASAGDAMAGFNYFNYFTEIEEHFWRKRGAHLLVSPLDWAILETWQKAGIPMGAVLKGIDRAF